MTENDPASPIWVESEWAELRECVYGSPDNWVLPRFLADSKLRAQGPFAEIWERHQGQDMKVVQPELFAAFSAQVQGAIDLLERLGITVQVAGAISPQNRKFPRGEEHGVFTGWMRDPFATIGKHVIELAPRSLFHRRQRFAIRSILTETMERGARYVAQPDPGADDETPGFGYLEGGDVFVLGRQIFVGHSGGCSNPEGARWLGQLLGPGYQVETIAIDQLFPHLDCVLMTPREGLAIACLEALPEGLPAYFRDWEVVAVPKALAKSVMACNNLVLNDRTLVVPSEPEHAPVVEALETRGFEVIRLPYRVPCMVGGSFRCAHQPLIRR
ncbi:MAG: hypothetical protein AAFY02_20615 [Pseudomonadota bacterium]